MSVSQASNEKQANQSILPGAEPSHHIDAWWGLVIGVVALVLLLVITKPDPFLRIILFMRDGMWVTVYITLISFVLVLFVGLVGGLGRLSKNRLIRGVASVYVEVIRGIPMIVQLIFWYFAFPSVVQGIGNSLNIESLKTFTPTAIGMAIFGLTLGYGAYMSEVYRAGIQSIPKGQMEAARSLGMNYIQAMRYVIIPQAVRVILPPVGNEFITLLKDSALVSVVAVPDMTRRGREFMTNNALPIQTWVMVALIYLIMTLFAARLVNWIEQKTRLEK